MKSYDTIIIGAGAAGLMCALTAGQRGRRVLVLERTNKVGKKILMSGGGKCNFTNLHIKPDRFLSANPHYCKSALNRYTQFDFIDLIEHYGIEYFEKQTVNGLSGQLFCQQSSKQVVAMLLDECARSNVDIRLNCDTASVVKQDGYLLSTSHGEWAANSLVVAAGGLSIPSLGGSGFGYQLADQFGLRRLPTKAGLVPFTFTDAKKDLCSILAGVSCEVIISCNDSESSLKTSFREDMLFTHRGLSGPAVLQISSFWSPGQAVYINLLPGRNVEDLLISWKRDHPQSVLRTLLAKVLPRKLVLELESEFWADSAEQTLAQWPDQLLISIAGHLKSWTLKPAATEGYRTAEVTLGGVDTRDLSSKTMESKIPGLFLIGEVVDVTGHLGGFNFQWAWSSGHAAGAAV